MNNLILTKKVQVSLTPCVLATPYKFIKCICFTRIKYRTLHKHKIFSGEIVFKRKMLEITRQQLQQSYQIQLSEKNIIYL